MASTPSSPARTLMVSRDPARAAVLAADLGDVRIVEPEETVRHLESGTYDRVVVLTDAVEAVDLAALAGLCGSAVQVEELELADAESGATFAPVDTGPSPVALGPDDQTPPAATGDLPRPGRDAGDVHPPAPQTSEPTPRASTRLKAVGAAALALGTAISALAAWGTDTGYVGLLLGVVVVLVIVLAGACWRDVRRLSRKIDRIERALRSHRRERTVATRRMKRRLDSMHADHRSARESVRLLTRDVTAQTRSIQVVAATQRETARYLARSLDTPALSAHLSVQLRQQQALLNLFGLLTPQTLVPAMGGWAASPDVIMLLVGELLRIRPRLVVECGSGVSTLWLALAIDRFRLDCRVVSLDHDPGFAEQTRQVLRAHGVDRVAEVRDAPLVTSGLVGHSTPWYDVAAMQDLADVGLLFVDGPPDSTGPLVRYPAIPMLRPKLAATVTVVLDDLVRPGEKEVVARWRLQLPEFSLEQLPLQKAAAVFRRVESPPPPDAD